jgi:prepilin-type processing-associated H-X9-DG protein
MWSGGYGNNDVIITLSSNHSGGVNVAFADASCRFLSETTNSGNINIAVWDAKTGISPYGVIGAISTINGGESVSAP